jgi:hypothetical protein
MRIPQACGSTGTMCDGVLRSHWPARAAADVPDPWHARSRGRLPFHCRAR